MDFITCIDCIRSIVDEGRPYCKVCELSGSYKKQLIKEYRKYKQSEEV